MLEIIHQGHLGQEKCLLRARTCVFWPGITKDVISLVQECNSCQRHQHQQQREPILQPEPPSYPWQRLNSDLFNFKGHQYLLVSDQYSKFPIIEFLRGLYRSKLLQMFCISLPTSWRRPANSTILNLDRDPQSSSVKSP